MPTGRKPNGAYEWDTRKGCWLNSDGSTFIPPPSKKPTGNVVGWDSRKGSWIYALPKRQKTKHHRSSSKIINQPSSRSSTFKSTAMTSNLAPPPPLRKKSKSKSTKTTKSKSTASAITTSTPINAAAAAYITRISTTRLKTSAIVFVPSVCPMPWCLDSKVDSVFHIDVGGVGGSGGQRSLYFPRFLRKELPPEEQFSKRSIPAPPSIERI